MGSSSARAAATSFWVLALMLQLGVWVAAAFRLPVAEEWGAGLVVVLALTLQLGLAGADIPEPAPVYVALVVSAATVGLGLCVWNCCCCRCACCPVPNKGWWVAPVAATTGFVVAWGAMALQNSDETPDLTTAPGDAVLRNSLWAAVAVLYALWVLAVRRARGCQARSQGYHPAS